MLHETHGDEKIKHCENADKGVCLSAWLLRTHSEINLEPGERKRSQDMMYYEMFKISADTLGQCSWQCRRPAVG